MFTTFGKTRTMNEYYEVYLKMARNVTKSMYKKLKTPKNSKEGKQSRCVCSQDKGVDLDDDGFPYCIHCQKYCSQP